MIIQFKFAMKQIIIVCICISLVWSATISKKSNKTQLKNATPRIINGENAKLGQFPWQAAISFRGDFYWFCGGSIINEEWIVTAGHCVKGAQYAFINTGLIELSDLTAAATNSTEFYLHEEYDGPSIANDIGLVKLTTPLIFDKRTQPIPLAVDPLDAGVNITVSGWGITSDAEGGVTDILKYVTVKSISNEECEESYEGVFDEILCAVPITDELIQTPCSGDSGSPVVTNAEANPVLVAVVSFVSDKGCEAGLPSGYTRMAYYKDWIANKTGLDIQ